MKLKIKSKLSLGLGLLFAIITTIATVNTFYVHLLTSQSKEILKDNYNSIRYAQDMLQAMDQTADTTAFFSRFEKDLVRQEENITETGEKKYTGQLRLAFDKMKREGMNETGNTTIRTVLHKITEINMVAIQKKNNELQVTAGSVFVSTCLIGGVCVVIAFLFFLRFPGYIANPMMKNITRYQELDQAKTDFIATVSHELKTPIASIKLSSQLLEDERVGTLNREQQHLVNSIKEDSERLLKLAAEVLNMAQVETGRIQLNFQRMRVAPIFEYAIGSLKFLAEQKKIKIVSEVQEGLPEVYVDPEKTVWVLGNLLSNAIRYSPEGGKIKLSASKRNDEIRFVVKDSGSGIDPMYKDKLFDKFFRVPGGEKNGTGLGLAIAKEFITAQKGHIGFMSENGKGTTFYFHLPIAQP